MFIFITKTKSDMHPNVLNETKNVLCYSNMSAHQLILPDESVHADVYQSLS